MIYLLIVNDHYRAGEILTSVQQQREFKVVGCAATLESALDQLENQPCDIVLVGRWLAMGVTAHLADVVHRKAGGPKVLVTEMPRSQDLIVQYLEQGVRGYVHEDESRGTLVEKIYAIYNDQFDIYPSVATALISRLSKLKRVVAAKKVNQLAEQYNSSMSLTAREREVFHLLVLGYTNQEIAAMLVIEVGTVKYHVHRVLHKLRIQKREDTILFAKQLADPMAVP